MIKVFKVSEKEDLESVFEVRKSVFVQEQNCPPALEWEYENESNHFLASLDGKPCGAARWRKTEFGYKLERFAVLKANRGKGIGQILVQRVLADLPKLKENEIIYLNAQLNAMTLYEKFGFKAEGPQFEEAGIQHFKMIKKT